MAFRAVGAVKADGSPHPSASAVVTVESGTEQSDPLRWRVHSGEALRSVWFEVSGPGSRNDVWCNGWQSWSPSGGRTLGVDVDPANSARTARWMRAMFHPDADRPPVDELRSEAIARVGGHWYAAAGGDQHDTTFRIRREGDEVIVRVEAWLGGCVPGDRALHEVHGADLLEDAVDVLGTRAGARVGASFQVGWCSWYHWFHDIAESALRDNLSRSADWPFDVFQLDDGWQPAIGDWLTTNDKFPSDLDALAALIAAEGRTPGIWLAPFLASPSSRVAAERPDWIVRDQEGEPIIGNKNAGWGGDTWVLDLSHPEVLGHLEYVARSLVEAGWRYLKLDFLYAAAIAGVHRDTSLTPAQRVRGGLDAIRRGAGDDVFLLGCGCPLAPAVGVVDGMRVGPDVAPRWSPSPEVAAAAGGYVDSIPSVAAAAVATRERAALHRRWWINDPDCVMLRSTNTELSASEIERWAMQVGESGGMVLVSDDLALLGDAERALLRRVIDAGRAADARATQRA